VFLLPLRHLCQLLAAVSDWRRRITSPHPLWLPPAASAFPPLGPHASPRDEGLHPPTLPTGPPHGGHPAGPQPSLLLPPASLPAATALQTVVILDSLASGASTQHRVKAQTLLPRLGWVGAAWEKAAAQSRVTHSL